MAEAPVPRWAIAATFFMRKLHPLLQLCTGGGGTDAAGTDRFKIGGAEPVRKWSFRVNHCTVWVSGLRMRIEFRLMSEQNQSGEKQSGSAGHGAGNGPATLGFGSQPDDRNGFPVATWGIAALIALVVVGALIYLGRKKPAAAPNTLQPPAAYAASLPLTQFAMSEAANLSGGKLTYLDGHVTNTGNRTVTAATVQVVFQNDEAMPPQIDTVPLTLIRMKEPYVDTEPVSTDPLKPGDNREFRLTFETVPQNWNTQMPQVRVIGTEFK
jgi:hypothetical protein